MTRTTKQVTRKIAMLCGWWLSGCAHSPPTAFFTLDPVPPERAAAVAAIAPVQLAAVHIPTLLDRPEIVKAIAGQRVEISEREHWAAPLAELLRKVLTQDLIARLPAGTVILPGAPAPAEVRRLVVNLLELGADPAGRATMQGSWTLLAGQNAQPLLSQEIRLSVESAPEDAGAQAAAIGRLSGELADDIAARLAGAARER